MQSFRVSSVYGNEIIMTIYIKTDISPTVGQACDCIDRFKLVRNFVKMTIAQISGITKQTPLNCHYNEYFDVKTLYVSTSHHLALIRVTRLL